MRGLGKTAGVLAAALGLFAACSYSPQLTSGQLLCSENRECPRGYTCSSVNRCCADGDLACLGSATGSGGASGSGGSGSGGRVAADYIGTWTFGATAKVFSECEDGSSGTKMLNGSTLAITAAGGTSLTANWSVWQSYGCPTTISLSYDATGAQLIDTNWFCESDTATLSDAWLVNSFDVTLASPTTATHYGLYYLEETPVGGSTLICQQTVTATLTKTKN